MKSELAAAAHALGFDVCRIAPAVAPPHAGTLREWLKDGKAGEMGWLGKNLERRTTPELVLPGAKAVVVLGVNYYGGDGEGERQTPNAKLQTPKGKAGRIARYAWGEDYHDVLLKGLKALDAWMGERGGVQRYYVDTGPVLERDFAGLAGVGWQGKSTMLIHPKFGTWLFLAELLTTLPLEPDEPMADHCGKCTRCMVACPTEAITRAREVDARRCVSYLTIENKGSIPEEFRSAIGDRIYGCDECLDVCPWNRFAQQSREAAFAAKEFVHGWSLTDLLALDQVGFSKLFRGSPIKRIKRRGLLRNVCVALGNIGTPDDLPALEMAAADPEPLIAEHAAWAIGRIRERFPLVTGAHRADTPRLSRT